MWAPLRGCCAAAWRACSTTGLRLSSRYAPTPRLSFSDAVHALNASVTPCRPAARERGAPGASDDAHGVPAAATWGEGSRPPARAHQDGVRRRLRHTLEHRNAGHRTGLGRRARLVAARPAQQQVVKAAARRDARRLAQHLRASGRRLQHASARRKKAGVNSGGRRQQVAAKSADTCRPLRRARSCRIGARAASLCQLRSSATRSRNAAAPDCACRRLRVSAGGMSDAAGTSGAPASPPACYLICHNVSKKHNGACEGG